MTLLERIKAAGVDDATAAEWKLSLEERLARAERKAAAAADNVIAWRTIRDEWNAEAARLKSLIEGAP